jgi:hypothetical protein
MSVGLVELLRLLFHGVVPQAITPRAIVGFLL